MKRLLVGLLVLVVVTVAVVLNQSSQFVARIEEWRKIVIAAQTAAPPEQNTIPEIMRAFAVRNGATIGGPSTVLANQRDEMTTGPGQPFFALQAHNSRELESPALSGKQLQQWH